MELEWLRAIQLHINW